MATKTIFRREDVEVRENFNIPVELYVVENSEEQADSQFEIYYRWRILVHDEDENPRSRIVYDAH